MCVSICFKLLLRDFNLATLGYFHPIRWLWPSVNSVAATKFSSSSAPHPPPINLQLIRNLSTVITTHYSQLKGILHQKNFYRLNLIFWIVMGCGIARFGRRGHGAVPRNPCAAPRNHMVLCLETPGAPRLKTPWGQILRPKFSSFGGF